MTRSTEVEVTSGSRLAFHPLRVKPDGGQHIVGWPAAGSYVALSDGALAALRLLQDGQTIAAVKTRLAGDHGMPVVRLRPLVETLLAAGLVRAVDGAPLPETLEPRRYHLTALRRRHVAWLFSRPAVAVYATLLGAGAAILLAHPRYLPRPADAAVVPSPWVSLVLLWMVSLMALAAHELAHLLAAVFLGIQGSFAPGNRLWLPVAQTDLTDLWLVDRNQRYLAYAAGMANDVLLASLAVIGLWLHDRQLLPLPHIGYGILRLALLVLAFGLAWQLNVYLRTDLYYLIANFTGCRNLAGDAVAYLKAKCAWPLTGAITQPLSGVPHRERWMVRGFAAIMVTGALGVAALGAACLGGLALALLGKTGGPDAPPPQSLWPLLATAGITGCWLAWAALVRRRTRPHLRHRLLAPEDL